MATELQLELTASAVCDFAAADKLRS